MTAAATATPEGASGAAVAEPPLIEARGLVKRYGDLTAVAGIDFEVRRGECMGFLGPNGAGKSTTLRVLYRASAETAGELTIAGRRVSKDAPLVEKAVKRLLGVVPQEDNLDQELTLTENLEVIARFYGLSRAERDARIARLLREFELEGKAREPVMRLSGGMKRRALIARALIHDPLVLILDEPTTGLDPQVRHHLWERLAELRRKGATLLLTTHYMEEAERLCDRILVIDAGKIVARGTPRELIARHVEPFVLEVRLDRGGALSQEPAVAALAREAPRAERLSDRLVLHGEDPEHLRRLAQAHLPGAEALSRRATLEDVFVRITGRRLEGGPAAAEPAGGGA